MFTIVTQVSFDSRTGIVTALTHFLGAQGFLLRERSVEAQMEQNVWAPWKNAPWTQRVARCLFWLSRRDRDFASFSLVPRDEIEIFSQNLRVRDEIEIFVHWISGFETRSRFSVIWSRNSRRDRDFSMKFFLPCDIQNCIFLYTTNTYSWIRKSQSNPRRDFLTPSWAIVNFHFCPNCLKTLC